MTTTGSGADTLSPTFTVSPVNGAMGVPYNTTVTVVFSEPINPVTLDATSFIVSNNGSIKAGYITIGQQNTVATFTPASPFFPGTPVTVTLKGSITDPSGNAIAETTSTFTSATTRDVFPPQVLQINPLNGATSVSATSSISVTFNEPLNPATVDNNSFIVSSNGVATPGSIVFSNFNTVVTYLPSQPLPGLSPVTVTLTTGITDLAGNAMAAPYTGGFTTASAVDNFQPSVVSVSPYNQQTGVPLNGKVTIVFSERVNPVTVNTNSFYIEPLAKVYSISEIYL